MQRAVPQLYCSDGAIQRGTFVTKGGTTIIDLNLALLECKSATLQLVSHEWV